MSGGQIAALVLAILLLLPGGCFVFLGLIFMNGIGDSSHSDESDPSGLLIGLAILALAGLLFWVAFRRRRPQTPS